MSTKNFTITIVRTGDFVEVSFTPHEKITNGQRTVIQRDDIRETLLNISDQLRTSNHHIRGVTGIFPMVSDLPKAQEPSDYVGWDFHTNQPIHHDAAKQTFWSTKVTGKYNIDEWLARKNGVSEETSDQPDRDFFNIWTSGADSNPLIALWAVTAEKPNKESLGESSHESIKETIKPVDKQPPVATLPQTDEEGVEKINPQPTSPNITFEANRVAIDHKTAHELNTFLNKISEAFNGNFISVRYKAGDILSLSLRRKELDYYSNVLTTLFKVVPKDKADQVYAVVRNFIHTNKVDLLIAVLETSYLCIGGKGYMFPHLVGDLGIAQIVQGLPNGKGFKSGPVMGRDMELNIITRLRTSGVLFRHAEFEQLKREAGGTPYVILPTRIAQAIGCDPEMMASRAFIHLILTGRVKINTGAYMPFWYRLA